jgi:hypothetical protein
MDPIEIRLVQDSIESVARIGDEATGNQCPLEDTHHHPCGLTYEEGQCQYCSVCSQMQDDLIRFLRDFRSALKSEAESAWTQTSIALASAMKDAASAHA